MSAARLLGLLAIVVAGAAVATFLLTRDPSMAIVVDERRLPDGSTLEDATARLGLVVPRRGISFRSRARCFGRVSIPATSS
jgi:hypothetical protein